VLLLFAILSAIVFVVCAFLYSRRASTGTLIGMLAGGVLAIGCAGVDSFRKVGGDTSVVTKHRKVAEARHIIQAEYLAKTIAPEVGRAVFMKDETSPVGALIEEGLRQGFGSDTELTIYTGESENFDLAASEETFQFTGRMIGQAARGMRGNGVLILAEPPNPLALRTISQRKPGLKIAVLNVQNEERAQLMAKRRVDYVVYSKAFEDRLSDQNGKFSGNLDKAFDGDFVLLGK